MIADKQLLFDHWSTLPITQTLLQYIRSRRQDEIPIRLIAARRLKDGDAVNDLIAELNVLTNLEKQIATGSFVISQSPKPELHK